VLLDESGKRTCRRDLRRASLAARGDGLTARGRLVDRMRQIG